MVVVGLRMAIACFARATFPKAINKCGQLSCVVEGSAGAMAGMPLRPTPRLRQKPFAFRAISVKENVAERAS